MNKSRKKFSYLENEEGKFMKTISDNGSNYDRYVDDNWKVIKKSYDPFENNPGTVIIDIPGGQKLERTVYGNQSEPQDYFRLTLNSIIEGNNNTNEISRMNPNMIIDQEKDQNGNIIRERVYSKTSESFYEYDEKGNKALVESWGNDSYWAGDNDFQYATIINNQYDEQGRANFIEETTYDDEWNCEYCEDNQQQYYKDNNYQYAKERYYLNNR